MNARTETEASEVVTLTNCEREPIRTPGSIQPSGVLIAASTETGHITHVSANAVDLLNKEPTVLLGRTLTEVLGASAAQAVAEAVRSERYAPAQVLRLQGLSPVGRSFLALAHQTDRQIIIELELDSGTDASGNLLARVQSVMQALRRTADLADLLDTAAREMKRLTGYDRVMVYRFCADDHGEVVAEACETEQEPYLQLRYPASDIPAQARQLYLQQRVRAIGEVSYSPVPVLTTEAEVGLPLDMTYCALRSVSPMHLQYLRNMGVTATLAVSLVHENALWGMLVCHHRTAYRPSPELRAFCDLIGQVLSLLIRAKSEAEAKAMRAARSDLLCAIADRLLLADNVSTSLSEAAKELLHLVKADGAFLKVGGQVLSLGQVPPPSDAGRIMAVLREKGGGEAVALDALAQEWPEFAPLAEKAAGALLLPLYNNPGDAILWVRREVVRTVQWGGNPDKAMQQDLLTGELTPRRSFSAWQQQLSGHSSPWSALDLEMARELRRIISSAMLRQAESRLAFLAQFDALTGLANRRAIEERMVPQVEDADQSCLIFMDLDRFKAVNDSMGHEVGDELLRQVARRLQARLDGAHTAARLGGDEFVIYCEGTCIEEAIGIASDLQNAFATPFHLAGGHFYITASFGVASSLDLGREGMLRSADLAMYAAKRSGGNKVLAYQERLHSGLRRRVVIEQELFGALDRGEIFLAYQPIVQVPDKTLLGFEALLRWHHPRLGSVSPSEFIPVAEETGLILPIGAWAMGEALRDVRLWREQDRGIYVSVNVSSHQLARPSFVQCIANTLAGSQVPPSALVIEVTESILMQEEAVRVLEQVRTTGVQVAIDDFGTGYSSLAYLRRLPVDQVKIDRSFIDNIDENPKQGAIFGAIVRLAHMLGLKVIAEGIETDLQWHYLRALDGDAAQGFWLAKPMNRDAIEGWMALLPQPPQKNVSSS